MMGLTSHISCVYDAFSSYHVSFSSRTSLMMMVLGRVHLVRAIFYFPLKITLGVSSLESVGRVILLTVSVEY